MKIRNLDTFFWVATLKSFRAAATHLHLTQPAITARIQVLEQDLGVDIFVRDAKKVELTPAGRRLLPYAERLVKLDQSVVDAFSNTTTVEQSIRLGSSVTIVGSWLPDFLTHYTKSRPQLNFDLTVDATDKLRDALVARELDLAFLMGPVAEASIENIELCSYEMVFAATKDIQKQHKVWTLKDIALQSILTFSLNTRPYRELKERLTPHTDGEVKITSSTSLGAITKLCQSSYGICALPRETLQPDLTSGTLVELKTDFELPPISFTASFVSSEASSGVAQDIAQAAAGFIQPSMINKIYQRT